MRGICEEKKVNVAKAKVECEELLVKIVQDKRIADDQEKQAQIFLCFEISIVFCRSMQKQRKSAKKQQRPMR